MGAEGRDISGYKVHATDGDIGKVDEARFDARRGVSLRQRELSSIRRDLHQGPVQAPRVRVNRASTGLKTVLSADPGGRVWERVEAAAHLRHCVTTIRILAPDRNSAT